jgi:long-chain fatty acid transport protein
MAGAGSALPQDAMTAISNPAGMVFVGNQWNVGATLFSPLRQYSVTGAPSGQPNTFPLAPGTVKSTRDLFLIPDLAANWMINKNNSLGFAMCGNGGMNTTYPASAGGNGTFHGGQAGVNLEQLFIMPTFAHKMGPSAAWGLSAVLAYQDFEARGLSQFAPFVSDGTANDLTDRGADHTTGYGARFSLMGPIAPTLIASASVQTRISMGRFRKYADLFAAGGSFDIPATVNVGLDWKSSPRANVLFDAQWIDYHDVAAVGNPFSNLMNGMMTQNPSEMLGGNNGPGFGWNNMTIYKLGYQYELNPQYTVRLGASYAEQPVPASEVLFNILAPGVQEVHVAAGLTRKLGAKDSLSLAAVYSPTKTVIGPNPLDNQTVAIQMHQFELEIGYNRHF